jgi:hypothetical protein
VLVLRTSIEPRTYLEVGQAGADPVLLGSGSTVTPVGVGDGGERVVYLTREGSASPELWLGPVTGQDQVLLSQVDECSGAATPTSIAVSPDGSGLVFVDSLGDLQLVDLATAEQTTIATGINPVGRSCYGLAGWSPDSSVIVYGECLEGCDRLVLTGRDGEEIGAAEVDSAGAVALIWSFSPDSNHLVVQQREAIRAFTLAGETSLEVPLFGDVATLSWVGGDRLVYGGPRLGTFLVDLGP